MNILLIVAGSVAAYKALELTRLLRRAGHAVTLVTVVETWGSAPRPPGALLAVRDDGAVSGSVSGGCAAGSHVHPAFPEFLTGPAFVAKAASAGLLHRFQVGTFQLQA